MSEQKVINVPIMADLLAQNKKPEYLFWVGSAGAFDDRYKKVSRAFAKLLSYLNIDYAILGVEETDSGDTARRAGNEMLFQMQAMMNIQVLNGYEVKNIITCDPHDYNTLKNEYPDLDGKYNVMHSSEFLVKLINDGILTLTKSPFDNNTVVTYHDPCYLGRANGVYEAPRKLLKALNCNFVEMHRNKSFALCCGAGGGQMFKEAEKGDKEIFIERIEDAINVNANIVVTSCPFCMTMMTDGIKYKNKEDNMKNCDIIELINMSLGI